MLSVKYEQYQKAYCSAIDWKSGVVLLHQAVIKFTRQALEQDKELERLRLELKALNILQFLVSSMEEAKEHPKSDSKVCDTLIKIYQFCMVSLKRGKYQKVMDMMKTLVDR